MSIAMIHSASATQLKEQLAAEQLVVLYKHSPTCGLCDIALVEINAFADANPDVPVWQVDVLSQRPISQQIEAMFGILHESPQAIVVRHGEPVWSGSHRRVTKVRLDEAVAAIA